jgi:branched-chain amino acid transport system substrate-binding protein
MVDCYISRVENGKLQVKKKVAKEELQAAMPSRVDFSKQEL